MTTRWTADLAGLTNLTLQAADASRATHPSVARTGGTALQLQTHVGDINIAGSGSLARCDAYASYPGTADPVLYSEGATMWVTHSLMLPTGFNAPRWMPYIVFDFHGVAASTAANFHVNFRRVLNDDAAPGVMQLQWFTGDPMSPTERYTLLDWPVLDSWYDFVYHVRWSSTNRGFFNAWLNGRRVATYTGPTLYAGDSVYLKLANYHLPPRGAFPEIDGTDANSSVIHDLVSITVEST